MPYFYNDADGNRQGPFNVQQLRVLAGRRVIQPATRMVMDEGQQGLAWQIPGLYQFTFTDANGAERTVNSQELRTLATQGIITPATPLKTDGGFEGLARQIPGMKFVTETETPPHQSDDEMQENPSDEPPYTLILMWVGFGILCVLALIGFFTWTILAWIALPTAIVLLILASLAMNTRAENILEYQAGQGDIQAQYDLARRYLSKSKYDEAAQLFKLAAEKGHVQAQVALGLLYQKGVGVEKNPVHAVQWFQKAVDQGSSDAQYELGCCYMMGCGVEEDDIKAFDWFENAAAKGSFKAQAFKSLADVQYKMALAYLEGEGKRKDPVQAVTWFAKAAEQGHAEAQYELDVCDQVPFTEEEQWEIDRFYTRYGRNVNTRDSFGMMLLHTAVERKMNIAVIKALVLAGADIHAKGGSSDETPLHFAAAEGHIKAAKYLVSKGANVNAKDAIKDTPLHNAAYNSQVEVYKFLNSKGASCFAKNIDGKDPLDLAFKYGDSEMRNYVSR